MRRIALVLLLMTLPSAAQEVEQVTVYGGSLSGFWHISGPNWVQMNMFGKVTWGPVSDRICRIGHGPEGYETRCSNMQGKGGSLEVDGSRFHLAWGSLVARMVFDGEVMSATAFRGHFAIKPLGMTVTDPGLSEGRKITLDPGAPDTAGKADLLRAVLNGEAVPHDPELADRISAARADQPGSLQQIIYLGRQTRFGGPNIAWVPNYFAVYAVEFSDGERICWLHQDNDGKLAAFQCS
ncbi:hypothetical protein AYO42_00900 [Rhizomicrobium sp. SCGC AG-212-E05]|nr:hypothetical protein AYO42_00900 [Rhizomicrobium sp. SCGC AG-212-E05]